MRKYHGAYACACSHARALHVPAELTHGTFYSPLGLHVSFLAASYGLCKLYSQSTSRRERIIYTRDAHVSSSIRMRVLYMYQLNLHMWLLFTRPWVFMFCITDAYGGAIHSVYMYSVQICGRQPYMDYYSKPPLQYINWQGKWNFSGPPA